jgi:hypothetical protein
MLENPRECRHLAICKYDSRWWARPGLRGDVRRSILRRKAEDGYQRQLLSQYVLIRSCLSALTLQAEFCDVCKAPQQTLAGSAKFLPALTDVDPVGPSIVIDAPASSRAASEKNSEDHVPQAGPSRRTSNDSAVGGLGADLPGFAKASTITKKRPYEDTQEVLHDRVLADSLFSATADRALEDATEPSFARKRSPFLIDDEDDSMELDAVQQMDVGDDSMLDEEAPLEEDQQMDAPEEIGWRPRRRPSRIEPTQQTGDPANATSSPEALPRALSRSTSDPKVLATKPLSYRRPNGIPDSDDEDEDLPTLPRAPSPKKTTQARTGPAGGAWRDLALDDKADG